MKILHLETSSKNCSVAISDGDEILCVCEEISENYKQSESLHTFVQWALEGAKITLNDLDAISLGKGPGSYTGLRIGVSAAKGLCYALGIPLIAVDTLQTLASQITVSDGLIIPMIDARRMEVYSAVFDVNHQNKREIQAEIIDENSFQGYDETLYFIGDCAAKCKSVLTKDNFVFLENIKYPSSKEMSRLSYEKYKISDTVDVAYFEPYYLKDFMITTSKK